MIQTVELREFYIIPRYGVVFLTQEAALKAAIISIDPDTQEVTRTEIVHVREIQT